MTPAEFHSGRVCLYRSDCREAVRALADNSVDSVVTDPPYALVSIVKRFGKTSQSDETSTSDRARRGADGMARLSRGFMGKEWDTGEVAFDPEFWRDVIRVVKPGGHVLAMGGTRTFHRLACAIEDAGFEIRDQIAWLYGSGFPKSHNVAVAIDKANGIGPRGKAFNMKGRGDRAEELDANGREFLPEYQSQTAAAREWQGWGTALKPALEPICLARKPLIGTVASNIEEYGTGALNIDGCRIGGAFKSGWSESGSKASENVAMSGANYARDPKPDNPNGRWPANVIHDGSDEVIAAFPDAPGQGGSVSGGEASSLIANCYGARKRIPSENPRNDTGSAARFFYTAKADADDRIGSKHPTVKPIDIERRMAHVFDGGVGRSVAIAKARPQKEAPLPMFPEAAE